MVAAGAGRRHRRPGRHSPTRTPSTSGRFDRVFLVNATGRSAAEILANLRSRLGNDEDTERAEVRAELRGIVRLRLTRWLS